MYNDLIKRLFEASNFSNSSVWKKILLRNEIKLSGVFYEKDIHFVVFHFGFGARNFFRVFVCDAACKRR